MDKLRLLYLIPNLEIGGAEIALANLVNQLPSEYFEIRVGGLFGLGPIQNRINLPPDRFQSFGFYQPFPFLDLTAYLRLFRFLRKNRIQIIHTHLPLANIIGRSLAWIAGIPIIISTEHNTYYDKSCPFIITDKLLSVITTQMTAVSEAVRSFASHQAHIVPDKFEVIPNCIQLQKIRNLTYTEREDKKRELGIKNNQHVIITVARLINQKGHCVLLDSARMVLNNKPEVLFLIVGGGKCETSLIMQAKQSGLINQVKFLGFRQDIYELLQISTMMVLPSLREGLPVTLLEASACFLPIVASNVGGVPEVVEDGVNGLLVPPGDGVALSKAIIFLLDSPNLRFQMGQEGRKIIENRYSAEVIAETTAFLYQRLWSEYSIRGGINKK